MPPARRSCSPAAWISCRAISCRNRKRSSSTTWPERFAPLTDGDARHTSCRPPLEVHATQTPRARRGTVLLLAFAPSSRPQPCRARRASHRRHRPWWRPDTGCDAQRVSCTACLPSIACTPTSITSRASSGWTWESMPEETLSVSCLHAVTNRTNWSRPPWLQPVSGASNRPSTGCTRRWTAGYGSLSGFSVRAADPRRTVVHAS